MGCRECPKATASQQLFQAIDPLLLEIAGRVASSEEMIELLLLIWYRIPSELEEIIANIKALTW